MIALRPHTALSVHSAALTCLTRGWSVIPLIGGSDAGIGKRPAVSWQRYQKQRPTVDEVQQWFERNSFSAYGIVCGKVSNLIVIDLDTTEAVAQFAQAFPELTHTFTVQSGFRGTPHLYFHVYFPVKTCKLKGGDLKGEGSYVVGPGSSIAGQTWQVVRDEPVRSLSKDELEAILRQLKLSGTMSDSHSTTVRSSGASADTYAERYCRTVQQTGERNNALFDVGRQMRDTGHIKAAVIQQLADLHACQTAHDSQVNESYERRYREALRTIDSVYTRPPQTARPTQTPSINAVDQAHQQEDASCLSNHLRERLLQQSDGTALLRTYEGLRLQGVQPGQIITRPEMFSLLRGIVGEHSIKRALMATSSKGHLLPRITPDGQHATNTEPLKSKATKCFVDRQKPPESHSTPTARPAHRPRKQYRMPSEAELCQWFGIELKTSPQDPVRMEDLQSVRLYRQKLEYELIRRRPGQYPMGWLADRLGVSPRTIYNYHRASDIEVIPCFESEPITWLNLQQKLPDSTLAKRAGIDLRGCYLEDEQGKRYPIRSGIARYLLARKHRLWLKRRGFNFYQCEQDRTCQLSCSTYI